MTRDKKTTQEVTQECKQTLRGITKEITANRKKWISKNMQYKINIPLTILYCVDGSQSDVRCCGFIVFFKVHP